RRQDWRRYIGGLCPPQANGPAAFSLRRAALAEPGRLALRIIAEWQPPEPCATSGAEAWNPAKGCGTPAKQRLSDRYPARVRSCTLGTAPSSRGRDAPVPSGSSEALRLLRALNRRRVSRFPGSTTRSDTRCPDPASQRRGRAPHRL